ncbi:peptide ABC transporter substrate-binding protein [Kaistia sp. 32K]|uniref:ABC transporter substrate-binding protein n=1 Tax=Kaistia sp. 32K TaxID=2795690 RepID=UPI001915AFBA|nr:ABC transporter substrate-binding protein [Kaistia sp. 32K]BCP52361.1 peptide ABC transporter substrate-binding protein [Kaistia sp. 32K]
MMMFKLPKSRQALPRRATLAFALLGMMTAGSAAETLTLAVALDNGSFDPAIVENGPRAQYWSAVYDTLLLMRPDGSITGNLAESYEYSKDNTVLTLKLRPGVKFTDGTPFNAAAVKANVEHLRGGSGQNSFMVGSVADIVIVDDLTVELHLSAANPAQLTYLTMAGGVMGSPAALGKEEIISVPVGSGPYVLDTGNSTRGARYTFVRNPDYWNRDAFPYDEVVLIPMGEITARMNALRSGQVNGAQGTAQTAAEAESSGLVVNRTPIDRHGLILADRNGVLVPALADVRVRQAINYAIDGEGLLAAIQRKLGHHSTQVFQLNSAAYLPELDKRYPFDPDKARALLAEAGYANGFELKLPENPTVAANPIIAQQLADVGIRVVWDKVVSENYVTEAQSKRYGAFWMSLSTGNPWWDVTKQISAAGPWNPFDSSTPELDALLAQARSASGADYDALMQKINTYVTENAWFNIWYQADAVYFSSPDVTVTMHPQNVVPYIRDFAPAR